MKTKHFKGLIRHLCLFISLILIFSGSFYAKEKNPGTGFFLRGGVGYSPAVTMKSSEANLEISGGGVAAVLSIGWFLNERLLVYGEFLGDLFSGPELTVGNMVYNSPDSLTANASGFGAGIGYYIVPKSIFAACSITFASIAMEDKTLNLKTNTDLGIGLSFQLGKDFQLSEKVLLGIAARAFVASMKDQGGGPTWNTNSIGILATISWASRGFAK